MLKGRDGACIFRIFWIQLDNTQGEQNKTKRTGNNKDVDMKSSYKAVRTNSVLLVPEFAFRFNLSSSPSWPPATQPASFHRPREALLGRHREDNLPGTFRMHHKVCCFPSLEM